MTKDKSNTNDQRDWNRQPAGFFDASPTQRRLYTQAYNELQREHPDAVIPVDLINERMQKIVNLNSPGPASIWIDSGDIQNAEAIGYASYFLTPHSEQADEFGLGPSDGKGIQYVRADFVKFQLDALNDICETGAELPPSVHAKLANMRDDLHSALGRGAR